MKTKLFALALLFMSFTIGYGHGPVKIQKTSNPYIFNLKYSGNEESKVVKVKVTDEQGNVVAYRTIKSSKHFNLPLNFANQQFGKYYVTVSSGSQSETQELAYAISSQSTKLSDIISHTLKLKSGEYLVSVPKEQITTARLTIFDADKNVLYTTTKKADDGVAFLLNTKNVQGSTSFEVTDASTK